MNCCIGFPLEACCKRIANTAVESSIGTWPRGFKYQILQDSGPKSHFNRMAIGTRVLKNTGYLDLVGLEPGKNLVAETFLKWSTVFLI